MRQDGRANIVTPHERLVPGEDATAKSADENQREASTCDTTSAMDPRLLALESEGRGGKSGTMESGSSAIGAAKPATTETTGVPAPEEESSRGVGVWDGEGAGWGVGIRVGAGQRPKLGEDLENLWPSDPLGDSSSICHE